MKYKFNAVAINYWYHIERIPSTTTRIHIIPPAKAYGKLTVLKRTLSMRQVFWATKTYMLKL